MEAQEARTDLRELTCTQCAYCANLALRHQGSELNFFRLYIGASQEETLHREEGEQRDGFSAMWYDATME